MGSREENISRSKGLGPACGSLMTLGEGDDLVYEFATQNIAATATQPTSLHWQVQHKCTLLPLTEGLRPGDGLAGGLKICDDGAPVRVTSLTSAEIRAGL